MPAPANPSAPMPPDHPLAKALAEPAAKPHIVIAEHRARLFMDAGYRRDVAEVWERAVRDAPPEHPD